MWNCVVPQEVTCKVHGLDHDPKHWAKWPDWIKLSEVVHLQLYDRYQSWLREERGMLSLILAEPPCLGQRLNWEQWRGITGVLSEHLPRHLR